MSDRRVRRWLLLAVVGVALLLPPYYVDESWLRLGLSVAAAAIGAIGLTILTGTAGQLSLAHAFFLGVGAVTYCVLAAPAGGRLVGLGWPTPLAALAGVVLAGLAGLAFSPIAGRLRHIYLGIASIALVLIGQHVLNVADPLTGGFNGRIAPDFIDGDPVVVGGVPFGEYEQLWYVALAVLAAAALFARNLTRGRIGRAFVLLRDSEPGAASVGVPVQSYKALAFVISSMYAGLAGVCYALAIGSVAPQSFALDVSVLYLVMVVIGGLGSIGGAIAGAAVVTATPILLQDYSDALGFLAAPGSGGVTASHAARFLFGFAVIAVIAVRSGAGTALRARFSPVRPNPRSADEKPAIDALRQRDPRADRERVQQ